MIIFLQLSLFPSVSRISVFLVGRVPVKGRDKPLSNASPSLNKDFRVQSERPEGGRENVPCMDEPVSNPRRCHVDIAQTRTWKVNRENPPILFHHYYLCVNAVRVVYQKDPTFPTQAISSQLP